VILVIRLPKQFWITKEEEQNMRVKELVTFYTHFKKSYRKYGPAAPATIIYKRLKSFRTSIERGYGLVKENRYRMEYTNTYMGIDNVTMHVIEHDIVLTQDIIFEYKTTGKVSPVIKV
jgi:hypothetical protein